MSGAIHRGVKALRYLGTLMPQRGGRDADNEILSRYLDEIGAHPLLTASDEQELGEVMQAGGVDAQDARRRFIQANLRLVVAVAKRFDHAPIGLLDLIQEGNLGLMRAVDRFDHTRGFKFSSYATWWIRQSIGRALDDTSRAIKVPPQVRGSLPLIDQVTERLTGELERPPTTEEVATVTGLAAENVSLALLHRRPMASLQEPIDDSGEYDIGDLLQDDEENGPFEAAAAALERQALNIQLSRLQPREREVLQARFGWNGPVRTAQDIANEMDVTRDQVRQIEAKALGKLRHPSVARLWASNQRRTATTS